MIEDRYVSLDELAGILGIHSRNLTTAVQRGVIVRAKRGAYPLFASIKGYVTHLRETAAGRAHVNVGSGLAIQRERIAHEQADALEMKNAAARGELLSAKDVEAMWSDVLRMLRARLLATPGRVQQRLGHLTTHDVATIDREIRDALAELSDDPI